MESTATQETPGEAIDRLAREQGRQKWWLANQLAISQWHLSRLVNDRKPVTPRIAHRLAEVFDVPVETFQETTEVNTDDSKG